MTFEAIREAADDEALGATADAAAVFATALAAALAANAAAREARAEATSELGGNGCCTGTPMHHRRHRSPPPPLRVQAWHSLHVPVLMGAWRADHEPAASRLRRPRRRWRGSFAVRKSSFFFFFFLPFSRRKPAQKLDLLRITPPACSESPCDGFYRCWTKG